MYQVIRTGSTRRGYSQDVTAPAGGVLKSFGDSRIEEAEALCDTLNRAVEFGRKARAQECRDLRAENDALSSKIIGLQFELGRAEVALKRALPAPAGEYENRRDAPGHAAICAAAAEALASPSDDQYAAALDPCGR